MDLRVITSPRKGALSVHGTNVLMNMVNVIGAMPTKNSQSTFFEPHEMISGEYVKENIWLTIHLPCLPGRLQERSGDHRRAS